jgi:hypothetical protein
MRRLLLKKAKLISPWDCFVELMLDTDGKVENLEIEDIRRIKLSNEPMRKKQVYKTTVKRAINNASPFPTLPRKIKERFTKQKLKDVFIPPLTGNALRTFMPSLFPYPQPEKGTLLHFRFEIGKEKRESKEFNIDKSWLKLLQ